ncbi:FAD/NAD(P)-binding protein [Chamaesiphon sp.]|uniref:FAD/NAD(P)-binding protein n=1 Tax=Chamaesiphon sp. TaxID=2814140 RepID=UPI00359363F6
MHYPNSVGFADSQPDRLDSSKYYDLAIIGAGSSSAYTLIHYITLLEQQCNLKAQLILNSEHRQHQPVRILVTEKSGEFWTGVPYGMRSGRDALLISSLKEFMPQQLEREHFINWLDLHRESIFAPADRHGELARKWLSANTSAMSDGRWDELFLPRSIFGLYLQQRLTALLAAASAKGLIEIDLVSVDVLDVRSIDGIYRIDGKNADRFWAKKLVLAIGSPPNVLFEECYSTELESEICCVNNMYEPSLEANIDRICNSLESDRSARRQVLIIGSNASTLDALYSIQNSPRAASLIDKFIIISPNGAFPHRIGREVRVNAPK